jgi:hypothetical protein
MPFLGAITRGFELVSMRSGGIAKLPKVMVYRTIVFKIFFLHLYLSGVMVGGQIGPFATSFLLGFSNGVDRAQS